MNIDNSKFNRVLIISILVLIALFFFAPLQSNAFYADKKLGSSAITFNESITVNFETNGGEEMNELVFIDSDTVVIPTPTNGTSTFAGWSLTENGTVLSNITFNVLKNNSTNGYITLYAIWD